MHFPSVSLACFGPATRAEALVSPKGFATFTQSPYCKLGRAAFQLRNSCVSHSFYKHIFWVLFFLPLSSPLFFLSYVEKYPLTALGPGEGRKPVESPGWKASSLLGAHLFMGITFAVDNTLLGVNNDAFTNKKYYFKFITLYSSIKNNIVQESLSSQMYYFKIPATTSVRHPLGRVSISVSNQWCFTDYEVFRSLSHGLEFCP